MVLSIFRQRMLKLELTDGFQTVFALEYTPVQCLTTKLTPGLKLLVRGPLRCVNHILFLEAKNVQVLGGELATLTVDNAYENVLHKKLNQPINPNPTIDYQGTYVFYLIFLSPKLTKSLCFSFDAEPKIAPDTNATQRAREIPSIPMTANKVIQSNVISSASHQNNLDDFPDDDFLNDIDFDQIASGAMINASAEQPNPQVHSAAPGRQSTLLFDDLDDNDFFNIDSTIEQMSVPPNEVVHHQQHSGESRANNQNIESALLNTSANASICSDNYRFKIRGLNLVTIKQLTETSPEDRIRRKQFIVKAQIDDIIQTARVSRNNKWKLAVLLTDPYSQNATLNASFSVDVLEKFTGITGREMNQLYGQREERPQVTEEIANILKNVSTKLEEMNTFMKMEFVTGTEHPVVVELIAPAPVLERKLQEKVENEQLI